MMINLSVTKLACTPNCPVSRVFLERTGNWPGCVARIAGNVSECFNAPLMAQADTNADGKLSRKELQAAESRLAQFLDGKATTGKGRLGGRSGEVITPAARGERQTDWLLPTPCLPRSRSRRWSGTASK